MEELRLKILSTLLLFSSIFTVSAQTTIINVDLNQEHQTIEGIGIFAPVQGLGGWPTVQELQTTADEGIALEPSIIRIGADPEYQGSLESSNDNADPNVLDLSAFSFPTVNRDVYLRYQNAGIEKFILTVWSPQGWMKSLTSHAYEDQNQWACPSVNNLCGGFLMPTMYDEFAEWVAGIVLTFESELGPGSLYAISPQNEPEFAVAYGSCVYTADELKDVTKAVYQRFQAEGIDTKIFYGEVLEPQGNILNFYNAIFNDPIADQAVHAMAYHDYLVDGAGAGNTVASSLLTYGEVTKNANKAHWMTETSGYIEAVPLARQMFKGFYYANISLWTYFGIRESEGEPYYATENFTKYVKPGAIRLGTDTIPLADGFNPSESGILPLAFKNPDDNSFTVIAINQDPISRNIQINFNGGSGPDEMDVYVTSPIHDAELTGTTTKGGQYFANIPPKSVATFYGEGVIDEEAPTKPDSLYTTIVIDTVVVLNFNASTDNVGIEEYEIYADGVLIDVSPGFTTYAIRGLDANTTYVFTVIAVDAAGNKSVASDPLIVITEPSSTGTNPTNSTTPTVTDVSFENGNISVSPNPTSDILNINNSEGMVDVTINDALGNTKLVTKSKSIDVSRLPSGVYYVAIEAEGQKSTQRILITH